MQQLQIVWACAGSGKTRWLTKKIESLLTRDKKGRVNNTHEFIIITFTRYAAEEMGQRLKMPFPYLGTFHSVSRTLLIESDLWKKEPFHVDEYQFAFHDEVENLSKSLSEVKYLFVDEFQDVNEIQYKIVSLLFQRYIPQLFIVGDENQNIYRFRGSHSKYMGMCERMEVEVKKETLNVNYRSTTPIVSLLNSISQRIQQLEGSPERSVSSSGREIKNGPRPQVFVCSSYQRMNIEIAKKIRALIDDGIPPHEIAVLSRTATPLFDLSERLRVPHQVWAQSTESLSSHEGCVILSTVHSSKGHGFEYVFVQVHNLYFPDSRCEVVDEWRLWYVAVSRCKTCLTIYDNPMYPSLFLKEVDDSLLERDSVSLGLYKHIQPMSRRVTSQRPSTSWRGLCHKLDGQIFRYLKRTFFPPLGVAFHRDEKRVFQDAKELPFVLIQKLLNEVFEKNTVLFPREKAKEQEWQKRSWIECVGESSMWLEKLKMQVEKLKGEFEFLGTESVENEPLILLEQKSTERLVSLFFVVDPEREFLITLSELLRCLVLSLKKKVEVVMFVHLETLQVTEIPLCEWKVRERFYSYVTQI